MKVDRKGTYYEGTYLEGNYIYMVHLSIYIESYKVLMWENTVSTESQVEVDRRQTNTLLYTERTSEDYTHTLHSNLID